MLSLFFETLIFGCSSQESYVNGYIDNQQCNGCSGEPTNCGCLKHPINCKYYTGCNSKKPVKQTKKHYYFKGVINGSVNEA